MTTSDSPPPTPKPALTCAACRVIDRADGVEDGEVWSPAHFATPTTRDLFSLMRRVQDRTADTITEVAGSMRFVYIHIIWFGFWIALNVGLTGINHEFDKFPFGLLTMIVSLEAIFLSTFVMISQNRADAKRQVIADHQWLLVQEEDKQNCQLLELSQQLVEQSRQILELTKAVHQFTSAIPAPNPRSTPAGQG
jgi:uncharacterized membrane protein